jgi:hypothetical protein
MFNLSIFYVTRVFLPNPVVFPCKSCEDVDNLDRQ